MTGMDCCVCYDVSSPIKCFAGCNNYLCLGCMMKLIDLNKADMLSYTCPCCREEIVKNTNEDFRDFCDREIEMLKLFVSLLERKVCNQKENHLAELWVLYQASRLDVATSLSDTEDDVEEYNASTDHYIEVIQTGYLGILRNE